MKRVVIIGGGIAGLSAGLFSRDDARSRGFDLDVVILEQSDRLGGNIRTERTDGWTIECGPNGFLDNVTTTFDLIARIGMEHRLQKSDERAAKRFLYRGGRLHLLPTKPIDFLKSPVLSLSGRLRVLAEPFARRRPADIDETIFEFAVRRIGREAALSLIDAMVSGIFAGNVHELSLQSTFPAMAKMESDHGSLFKAMIARRRRRKIAMKEAARLQAHGEQAAELTRPGGPAGPGGTLTSFDLGLDGLISGLATELGPSVHTESTVTSLELMHDSETGPWRIRQKSGEVIDADAVVLAVPAEHAAGLLEPLDSGLSGTLRAIQCAGLAVVALGFEESSIGGPPDGFGFLVPREEGPRVLGCLWDSSLFPGRAPTGKVLLRAMIGGAHDPEAVTLSDDALIGIVRDDLRTIMGIDTPPIFHRVYRHPRGISQYGVGHAERLEQIQSGLGRLPGCWVTGSSYHGVSMNACIETARRQAGEIVSALAPPAASGPIA